MGGVPLYQHPRPFVRSCIIYTAQSHHREKTSHIDARQMTITPISQGAQVLEQVDKCGCHLQDQLLLPNLRIEDGEIQDR